MSLQELRNPIMIFAAAGSGELLLTRALSAHSALVGVDDGGLCRDLMTLIDLFEGAADGTAEAASGLDASVRAEASDEAVLRQAPDVICVTAAGRTAAVSEFRSYASKPRSRQELLAFARELIENAVAGDRPPAQTTAIYARHAARHASTLTEVFPDALIVHLIRDPRAIAVSNRAGRRAVQEWLTEVRPLLALEAGVHERLVKIAYEDLLVQTGIELGRLCVAADLAPELTTMTARFAEVCSDGDRFVFHPGALDGWQVIELEETLGPALPLLGYHPAADVTGVNALRAEAERARTAVAEAEGLRTKLREHEQVVQLLGAAAGAGDPAELWAMGEELVRLRRELAAYEETHDELRELRAQVREQRDRPTGVESLRWKAKRYDRIRAAASPLLRFRRYLAQREARRQR